MKSPITATCYRELMISSYIAGRGSYRTLDFDFFTDVVVMLDELVAGTLSYLIESQIPDDIKDRLTWMGRYVSQIEDALATDDLESPTKPYLYALLSAAYWVMHSQNET